MTDGAAGKRIRTAFKYGIPAFIQDGDIAESIAELRAERDKLPYRGHLVYFAKRSDGLIKIGWVYGDATLETRITALRVYRNPAKLTCRLMALQPGGHAEEQALHAQFADERAIGEWFNPSERLTAFITALPVHPSLTKTLASIAAKPRKQAPKEPVVIDQQPEPPDPFTDPCPHCNGTGRVTHKSVDPPRPDYNPLRDPANGARAFDRAAFEAQRVSLTREDSARKPRKNSKES